MTENDSSAIYRNSSALSVNELSQRIWNQPIDYLQNILTAQVYDVAKESPLQEAKNLSHRLNNTILIKREDLQSVFSFKLRGAYNKMKNLTEEEMAKGVITCSAGNHAQGVALAAQKLLINATIIMPLNTPPIKWKNVQRLGAKVLLFGSDFDEAKAECYRIAKVKYLIKTRIKDWQ
jgi:threonine dehydratase